jgi:preprotein translocase subunit SecG
MATFWQYFFGITLFLTSLFLILLVLVQRGRGGGLAGALGGPGGQSAFGTKAGDTFTWVTAGTALVWIFLSMAAIKLIGEGSGGFGNIQGSAPLAPAVESPLGDPATRAKTPSTSTTPLLPATPEAPAKAEKE